MMEKQTFFFIVDEEHEFTYLIWQPQCSHRCCKINLYRSFFEWAKTKLALSKVVVRGEEWPKQSSVRWTTPPTLIRALCRTGIVPQNFFNTGSFQN